MSSDRILPEIRRTIHLPRLHEFPESLVVGQGRDALVLDVGVWNAEHRTFGLVAGNLALLCEWTGHSAVDAFAAMASDARAPLPPKLQSLLDCPDIKGRINIRTPMRGFAPFVPPDDLLIAIPDLHLCLFPGSPYDDFKTAEGESHADALGTLLTAAQEVGASIYQLGDLYDVWEAEILLMICFENLQKLKVRRGDQLGSQADRMIRDRRLPASFEFFIWCEDQLAAETLPVKQQLEFSSPLTPPVVPSRMPRLPPEAEWIPLGDGGIHGPNSGARSVDAILQHIRRQPLYASLFPGGGRGLDAAKWIPGNHDNVECPNNYYEKDHGVIFLPTEAPSKIGEGAKPTPPGNHMGHVWLEHGHDLDPYNSDRVFARHDAPRSELRVSLGQVGRLARNIIERGFGTTANGPSMDRLSEGLPSGMVRRTFLNLKAALVDTTYAMRADQLLRAEEIFLSRLNVRLVIMGHTHDPWLGTLADGLDELRPNLAYGDKGKFAALESRTERRVRLRVDHRAT